MPSTVGPDIITFLVVGCQRCGTSWLDAALREHPAVYLPPQKQTYFFDEHYDRGLDWYLGQFEGVRKPEHAAVGEVATGYCLPDAAERMARDLPHVKLVMTMRHPVERAYSNYLLRKATHAWSSFEETIDREPDLLARGRYIEQIEALLAHYDRDRLHLLLYEDLDRNDRAYLGSILEFIGLDPGFESSQFGQRRNAAMFPRLRVVLDRMGLKPAVRALSRSPVGDLVRRTKKRGGRKSSRSMKPETRARLVDYYRPFNARLGELLGRDLSHWDR